MASNDFKKILVKDDAIGCLSDSITYSVYKGGQSVNTIEFNSVSSSPTQITYNIQVPSLETVISRNVMIKSKIRLKITDTLVTRGTNTFLLYPALTDAPAPYPMNQIIQNASITINNNTVTCQVSDVLQVILRSMDQDEMAKYNGSTPTTLDQNFNYADAIIKVPNTATFNAASSATNSSTAAQARYISLPQNVLGGDITRNVGNSLQQGRGTYLSPSSVDFSLAYTTLTAASDTAYIEFECIEPLFCSPFTWGNQDNKSGMYGISNMNVQLNLGNANRIMRYANMNGTTVKTVTIESIDSSLIFEFLTCHPSDLLSSRCVLPYYEMPLYKTPITSALTAKNATTKTNNYRNYATVSLNSQSLQLSVIPDKLFIYVRRTVASMNGSHSDTFYPIKKLSINFNNQSGILSSATQATLHQYSTEAGLNQSWSSFIGETVQQRVTTVTTAGLDDMPNVNGYKYADCLQLSPNTGSAIALNFGQHIPLIEDYYAPGSLGSFNLSITAECYNHTEDAVPAGQAELVICVMNSGIMSIERGVSSVYTGLLVKTDVLDASSMQAYTQGEVKRMIGGGWFDNLKSAASWINDRLPLVKRLLQNNRDDLPSPAFGKAGDFLEQLGYAKPKNLAKRIMM